MVSKTPRGRADFSILSGAAPRSLRATDFLVLLLTQLYIQVLYHQNATGAWRAHPGLDCLLRKRNTREYCIFNKAATLPFLKLQLPVMSFSIIPCFFFLLQHGFVLAAWHCKGFRIRLKACSNKVPVGGSSPFRTFFFLERINPAVNEKLSFLLSPSLSLSRAEN